MPGMINRGGERPARVTYGVLGAASLVVLTGLVVLLMLGACTGQPASSPEPEHTHTPGTLLHTHAPPGSAGEILEKKLEDALPTQAPNGHQGSEGLKLGNDSGKETVYAGALCDPSAGVRQY